MSRNVSVDCLLRKPVGKGIIRSYADASLWSGHVTAKPQLHAHIADIWPKSTFRLDRSSLFAKFSEETQSSVLFRVNLHQILEALHIEKIGMAYAAKMILLADSVEERMFFSGMASEEARHFDRLLTILGDENNQKAEQSFLEFIANTVEESPRAVLLFVIQVVLEGWGLYHYRSLAQNASIAAVKEIFKAIIRDEARHHGAGRELFDDAPLHASELKMIRDLFHAIVEAIRVGPESILSYLARASGGLSKEQCREFMSETESFQDAQKKLTLLQGFMTAHPKLLGISEEFTDKGFFVPYSITSIANLGVYS